MKHILITVKINNTENDLKIPSFITGAEFLSILNEIVPGGIKPGARIQAEPIGRILDNLTPLYKQNVDNGAALTII